MQVSPPESREFGDTYKVFATRVMAPLARRSWRGVTVPPVRVVSFFDGAYTLGRALRKFARLACAVARQQVLIDASQVGPPFRSVLVATRRRTSDSGAEGPAAWLHSFQVACRRRLPGLATQILELLKWPGCSVSAYGHLCALLRLRSLTPGSPPLLTLPSRLSSRELVL